MTRGSWRLATRGNVFSYKTKDFGELSPKQNEMGQHVERHLEHMHEGIFILEFHFPYNTNYHLCIQPFEQLL